MMQARFREGICGASQRRGLNHVVSPRYQRERSTQ
jgi:hypothetical protein